jgi:cytochrome P450
MGCLLSMVVLTAQSISTLLAFLLAILLHPEVQAKAQAEIDRVVGKDRLPAFHDRQALPYVDAILRETLRWQPVFPLGPFTILMYYLLTFTFDDILRCSPCNNDR